MLHRDIQPATVSSELSRVQLSRDICSRQSAPNSLQTRNQRRTTVCTRHHTAENGKVL